MLLNIFLTAKNKLLHISEMSSDMNEEKYSENFSTARNLFPALTGNILSPGESTKVRGTSSGLIVICPWIVSPGDVRFIYFKN